MKLQELEQQISRSKLLIGSLIVLLPSIYFVWFYLLNDVPLSPTAASWGTFGDYIGGILNPLVAFSAFIWLTRSVLIQKTELEDTKLALVASQKAQQEQANTLADQRFDATFFALLEQHNLILNHLTADPAQEKHPLRMTVYSKMTAVHHEVFRMATVEEGRAALEISNAKCGHYFRLLYQLLKYVCMRCPSKPVGTTFDVETIKNSPVDAEEKFYANIVRSFLSYEVTQLLAINCCVADEDDSYFRYKLLVERYELLEHMPLSTDTRDDWNNALLVEAHSLYAPRAFGKSDFVHD